MSPECMHAALSLRNTEQFQNMLLLQITVIHTHTSFVTTTGTLNNNLKWMKWN